MKTDQKPTIQERVENLQVRETGDFIELSTAGLQATFYHGHLKALEKHFFDIEKDYLKAVRGESIDRTNQGYLRKLFEKTLRRIHKAHARGLTSYVRWLAVATATWLKLYLAPEEHIETVIDNFLTISDDELNAETTQRARQMVMWQIFCLHNFAGKVQHPEAGSETASA
ncbi:hypothetical protein ACFL54_04010 [Planctomycetota bacterium]